MRAKIQSFDNHDGTASACRLTIHDACGATVGFYQTRWYRTYPRGIRAFSDAENFAKIWARKRSMTCTVELTP